MNLTPDGRPHFWIESDFSPGLLSSWISCVQLWCEENLALASFKIKKKKKNKTYQLCKTQAFYWGKLEYITLFCNLLDWRYRCRPRMFWCPFVPILSDKLNKQSLINWTKSHFHVNLTAKENLTFVKYFTWKTTPGETLRKNLRQDWQLVVKCPWALALSLDKHGYVLSGFFCPL